MNLKPETVAKYIKLAMDALNYFIAILCNCHVAFSYGNEKIGRVLNVSLLPILTCGKNCRVCKGICYDIKACLRFADIRGGVLAARAKNTALALYDEARYFEEIDRKMSRRKKNKFLRWHVGGDIPSLSYFIHMVELARKHPDFVCWTYTKQYYIVNEYCRIYGKESIPENLSVMFSVWDGLELDNPYGFATFKCVLTGRSFTPGVHRCPGNCKVCLDSKTGCPYQQDTENGQH